jgi:hypothetical protein
VKVRGVARWCLNTGKWLWRCQCRTCLPYCESTTVQAEGARGGAEA